MYLTVDIVLVLCAAVSVMGLIMTEKEEEIVDSIKNLKQ